MLCNMSGRGDDVPIRTTKQLLLLVHRTTQTGCSQRGHEKESKT
uniref:Uncharacterized protein n=1 Tax=Arundo donax TaxID=35708 RepID=A0A0A9HER4_ARUDO